MLAQFAEQTRHMLQLRRVNSAASPEPDDEDALSLVIDFDAPTPQGHPLHYRAECRVAGSDAASLTIRARRQN